MISPNAVLAATFLPREHFPTRLKACNYCMQELQRVACNNCTSNHVENNCAIILATLARIAAKLHATIAHETMALKTERPRAVSQDLRRQCVIGKKV